jgi:flagellar biogenesis protein FliO
MEYTSQALAVAVVLALLATALWWLRRRGWAVLAGGVRPGGRRKLELLERLVLGPQHSLHLVRVGGEVLLVACSPASCGVVERVAARVPESEMGEPR